MSVVELFLEAHSGEAGAARAHGLLVDHLERGGEAPEEEGLPPAPELLSASLNALGEMALDRAVACGFPFDARGLDEARAARGLFERAVGAMPRNCEAAMSLALLHRDTGETELALQRWQAVASMTVPQQAEGSELEEEDEWAAMLARSRRQCVPLACIQLAIALSSRGR